MPTESQLSLISGDVHKGVVGVVSGFAGLGSEIRQAKKEKQAKGKSSDAQKANAEDDRTTKDIPELDATVVAPEDAYLKSADQAPNVVHETGTPVLTMDGGPKDALPMPVIIPQRRPGEKRKGFARAYAPVLENAGITQDVWLKFIKDFDDSSQASQILTVIQLGVVAAGFVPDAIVQAVAASIQTAAEIGIELQMRKRTNTFLHKMNESFFMRRGLYAMVMKYKPDADPRKRDALGAALTGGIRVETVDLHDSSDSDDVQLREEEAITQATSSPEPQPIPENDPKGFRLGVGRTQGALQLPQSAPLVWPDMTAGGEDAKGFKASMSRKREFMPSYLDRRAHMHYANKDPESTLIVPEEQRKMKSKWADPNSKVYNHAAVKLMLAGGVPTSMSLSSASGGMLGGSKDGSDRTDVVIDTMPGGELIRGVLRQNALYLMVVNLPSEEELARAREQLKAQQK